MEQEILQPVAPSTNTAAQSPGGMVASPQSFDYNKFHIEGVRERIRIGDIDENFVGNGIYIGKSGSKYVFSVGDATGNYLLFDGSTFTIAGIDVMTYAAVIGLVVNNANVHKTTTVNATGNATINANSAGNAGQEMTIIIANDATSGKVITFGTNFRSAGTITGTASKTATIKFTSDGTAWFETCRTLAL